MSNEPSPEVKAILRSYVEVQREKYGENWKEIKAAEMAAKTAPVIGRLFDVLQGLKK
ncbi:hypothetical protein [Mesorhizobium sp.]|uniref:hypothetical protein n=1 Tax=Mesorhizobium sp. TaxID=1871066 RepID=UPI00257AEA51|nr:hypothetical protein [Mesorhizobium sp.]